MLAKRRRGVAEVAKAEEKRGSNESVAFVALLRDCGKRKDLAKGTSVHDEIVQRGLLQKCSNALITMYAKCGALEKAKELLVTRKSTDVFTWTALIAAYNQKGQSQEALACFEQMRNAHVIPDLVTFVCVLKACGSVRALAKGKQIQDEITNQGLLAKNVVLGTALIDMYAKCGAIAQAARALEELPIRDVVSWNAILIGYANQDKGEQAVNCFERMQCEGVPPNSITFTCILKVCGSMHAIELGETVHDEIVKQGLLRDDIALGTALVDMYAKCGALEKACQTLKQLPTRNTTSWNALIAGYAQDGHSREALNCFKEMQFEGHSPSAITFTCILKACGNIGVFEKGEDIHDDISKQGLLGSNLVLGNALVDMYVKCGALEKAQRIFKNLPTRNVVSWNALIAGYSQRSQGEQALACFEQMRLEGVPPDEVTFLCLLKACGTTGEVDKVEKIHDEIARQGILIDDVALGNALVDMYVKCNSVTKAQVVLEELPTRDVVSWSALIAGYAQQGEGEQALYCFERMQCEGLSPGPATFVCILNACASMGSVDKGEQIHTEIARQGLLRDDNGLGSALVDMYAKCGALKKARRVLEQLAFADTVAWNALIGGYAQHGQAEQAVLAFERMQSDGFHPDAATMSCVLSACNLLGLVDDAKMFLVTLSGKYGMNPDLEHYSCMLDLFGRAGHLDKAVHTIQKMPCSGIEVWSALLGSCRKWGDVKVGKWAFEQAVQANENDAEAYVLMANIYRAAGMEVDADNIEALGRKGKVCKGFTNTSANANSCLVGVFG